MKPSIEDRIQEALTEVSCNLGPPSSEEVNRWYKTLPDMIQLAISDEYSEYGDGESFDEWLENCYCLHGPRAEVNKRRETPVIYSRT